MYVQHWIQNILMMMKIDLSIVWSVFWTTYWSLGFWFPRNYQTKHKNKNSEKSVNFTNLISLVRKNMFWTLLFQYVFYFIFSPFRFDPGFRLYRFVISALITEIIFFTMHKIFHSRKLYKYHKVHHEITKPCALSAMYCHPLEAIFCNQMATIVGPIITCMSFQENIIWSILISINTLKAHSGLRWNGFNSRYHDIHHQHQYKNYGFLYIPDIYYGSCLLPSTSSKLSSTSSKEESH